MLKSSTHRIQLPRSAPVGAGRLCARLFLLEDNLHVMMDMQRITSDPVLTTSCCRCDDSALPYFVGYARCDVLQPAQPTVAARLSGNRTARGGQLTRHGRAFPKQVRNVFLLYDLDYVRNLNLPRAS